MKLSKELTAGNLHPRENLFITGILAALNAEIVIPGDGIASVLIDLRDTFNATFQLQGTVDGTNYQVIPVRPTAAGGGVYVSAITGTTQGVWAANCSGYKSVRLICTAFTSGSAVATLMGTNAPLDETKQGVVTPLLVTATGAAGAAVTLTLPAPGVGLRQYLTFLRIVRFASALLTAAATPVVVTTTNLPGALAFSLPAEAAPQGTLTPFTEDFGYPLMASAQNTAVTIVAPLTTGVLWRLTAGYYVAP